MRAVEGARKLPRVVAGGAAVRRRRKGRDGRVVRGIGDALALERPRGGCGRVELAVVRWDGQMKNRGRVRQWLLHFV